MSTLKVGWDFKNPKYRDTVNTKIQSVPGGENVDMLYAGGLLFDETNGMKMINTGTTVWVPNAVIPVKESYTLVMTFNPDNLNPGKGKILYTSDQGMSNGGFIRVWGKTSSYPNCVTFEEIVGGRWYNTSDKDKTKPVPNLFDGREKTVTVHHPNVVGEYIKVYINGNLVGETLIKDVTLKPNPRIMLGDSADPSYERYTGNIGKLEIHNGLIEFSSYALLDVLTNDIYSVINNEITMIGNESTITSSVLKEKGVSLEDIKTRIVPEWNRPFKIMMLE